MKSLFTIITQIIFVFFTAGGDSDLPKYAQLQPVVKYETGYIILYENIVGTVYHPVPGQTDDTPLITADMTHVNPNTLNHDRYVALSRNLINQKDRIRNWDGKIPFGSKIIVESPYEEINGEWTVHDTMNKRYKQNIDFFQNHKDPSSIYGKWFGLKIKIQVTYKRIYIGDKIINEEIV